MTTTEELMEADRRTLHDSLRLGDWEGAFYAQQRLTVALQARLDAAAALLRRINEEVRYDNEHAYLVPVNEVVDVRDFLATLDGGAK